MPMVEGARTLSEAIETIEEAYELMLAYAAGDAAAFERLYQRHRGKLYRFLARQLHGNGALADVRAAAANAAVSAASTILSQSVKGSVADDLLAKGIAEVRAKLN